jgi:hypothetical protein
LKLESINKNRKVLETNKLFGKEAAAMSVTHRFLVDAVKLRALHNEKAGRILACMEENGVGCGSRLP